MLQTSLVGYGRGLRGLGAPLTLVDDYNCNGSYCWGVGARQQLFVQLQTLANSLAQRHGLPTVEVDGFLGRSTQDLINALIRLDPQRFSFLGLNIRAIATFQQMAANADRLVLAMLQAPGQAVPAVRKIWTEQSNVIGKLAAGYGAGVVGDLPVPNGGPSFPVDRPPGIPAATGLPTVSYATPTRMARMARMAPTGGDAPMSTMALALTALGVVGVGVGGYYLINRRKRRAALRGLRGLLGLGRRR